MNQGFLRKEKGITLVALVVTIVVLVILAGVSISLVLSQYGIIGRAQVAGETQRNAQNLEEQYLQNADLYINEQIAAAGEGGSGGGDETFPKIEGSLIKTGETEVTNGTTKPYLPSNDFKVSDVSTEQTVAAGLVIKHKTIGDEYVWIEVPRTIFETANGGTAGLNITEFNNTNLRKIRDDLQKYTEVFRKGNDGSTLEGGTLTSAKDWWYDKASSGTGTSNQVDPLADSTSLSASVLSNKEGCGLTYSDYQTKYKAMLQSVYENGGFYIGRYEAGIAGTDANNVFTGRGSHTNIASNSTETPVSQADFIPYNRVYCSEAQTLANNVASGSKTSSLMFGVQWDLVLKYLKERGNLSLEQLKGKTTGSTDWGNYRSSNQEDFTLTKGKYTIYNGSYQTTWKPYNEATANYVSVANGTSTKLKENANVTNSGKVLLTTGAMPSRNMKQNIHDFAGNVWEWTLEYTSNSNAPCSGRGGSFQHNATRPASYRSSYTTTDSDCNIGFRVSLW